MYTIDRIKSGDQYAETIFVDEDTVKKFAEVSGDFSPIHLDEEYAGQNRFGRRIAHGMLLGSFISRIIGMHLPGEGTIYVSQNIQFLAPVYLGTSIVVSVEVTKVDTERKRVTLKTSCVNDENQIVLTGEAIVIPP